MHEDRRQRTLVHNAGTVILLAGIIAVGRLIPHPWNFTPVYACILYLGASASIPLAILACCIGLFTADLFLGFYPAMVGIYAAMALATLPGLLLRNGIRTGKFLVAVIASPSLFFLASNFVVWLGDMYPHNPAGLGACYIAALPFFGNSLLSSLVYSPVLFGVMIMKSELERKALVGHAHPIES